MYIHRGAVLLSTEGDLERALASTDASGREDGGLKAEQLVKDHCRAVLRLEGVGGQGSLLPRGDSPSSIVTFMQCAE